MGLKSEVEFLSIMLSRNMKHGQEECINLHPHQQDVKILNLNHSQLLLWFWRIDQRKYDSAVELMMTEFVIYASDELSFSSLTWKYH